MALGFVAVDRDQQFLMPPDVREWLPADHEVWFLLDVVGLLDLGEFEAAYRLGGQGRAAYDPRMMLAVFLYAVSRGILSSRKIERACHEEVGLRVICAGHLPDHSTLARFYKLHRDAIGRLFVQVLGICKDAGLVRLGLVAIDGTKLSGNAALDQNRTVSQLDAEVGRLLDEYGANDEAEDEQFGDRRGDELPPELVDRAERLARLLAAKQRLEEHKAHQPADKRREPKTNLTDPDSRIMKTATGGFVQGYNAQLAVNHGQLIVAAELTNDENDINQLVPMLEALGRNLAAVGIHELPDTVLADAGYFNEHAIAEAEKLGVDPLVGTAKRARQPDKAPEGDPAADYETERARVEEEVAAERARRAEVFERIRAGELNYSQAAELLDLDVSSTWRSYQQWLEGGVEAIGLRKRGTTTKRPSSSELARRKMETKLADPANRALYKKRGHLVEGAIAHVAHHRNGRRLLRRGLDGADSELKLRAAVHNIAKLRTALIGMTNALRLGWMQPAI